jgi:2-haloacid dehalogenase
MTIDAVIFDIGNVLVEWHPLREFDRLIGEARRKDLFANVDLMGMNDRVDLGADMPTLVRELAEAHPEYSDEVLLWEKHWLDMLSPDIPHSARMLRALRAKGVPTYALSNFGTGTLALADRHFPILTEFDHRFVSGHLALMKPDPAIYAHVEQTLPQFAPHSLFFIDDRADNIAAAQARGWQGHLFEHPEGLAERLVQEGLLSAAEAA